MGNSANINPKGGNKILLVEVTAFSGTLTIPTLTLNTNCIDLGHLSQSSFDSQTSDSVLRNEMLDKVYTTSEFDDVTEGILMERHKILQDFLRYYVVGKFFLQLHYQGIANAKWQEELSIVQVTPQRNNQFPSGATSFKYKANKIVQDVDLVISSANITTIEVAMTAAAFKMAGPATIAAGRYDILTETTVV